MHFSFQLYQEKGIDIITPILTKKNKTEQTKSQLISWTHQRTRETGQTTILQTRQVGKSSES